ncbi:MAG: hypothetical protein NTX22_09770 [Ignavibacteriales bacterium]|nr:hypothetical protein [Ignavibacteriales bacterium]
MFSQKYFFSISILGLILIGLFFTPEKGTNAQTTQRIGVFDSRAVVVAYYNSKYFKEKQIFDSLGLQMKNAKEKDDKKTIAKIEREGTLRQAMMHEQGFGKGSINNITETMKDKMAILVKNENLTAIVSKWELVYSGTDVELVDITEKIVDFFEPSEKIKSMMKEIMQSEPIKDAYLIED